MLTEFGLIFLVVSINSNATLSRTEELYTMNDRPLPLVNLERAVDGPNEVVTRRVAGRASNEEEGQAHEEHVAKVHHRRHKLCL